MQHLFFYFVCLIVCLSLFLIIIILLFVHLSVSESESFIYITFMPSCNFPLLLCSQEEADTSLSSVPLLFLAFQRGVRPKGKKAEKQNDPQHNNTKAQQNQQLWFSLPGQQEGCPRSSIAAPAEHGRGMLPSRGLR